MYTILWHHHFNFIYIYTFIDVIIRVSPTSRLLNSFLVIFFVSTSLETSSSHNHKPLNWGKARGHLVVEKNWSWIYHLYSQRLYLTQWRLTRKKRRKKRPGHSSLCLRESPGAACGESQRLQGSCDTERNSDPRPQTWVSGSDFSAYWLQHSKKINFKNSCTCPLEEGVSDRCRTDCETEHPFDWHRDCQWGMEGPFKHSQDCF